MRRSGGSILGPFTAVRRSEDVIRIAAKHEVCMYHMMYPCLC